MKRKTSACIFILACLYIFAACGQAQTAQSATTCTTFRVYSTTDSSTVGSATTTITNSATSTPVENPKHPEVPLVFTALLDSANLVPRRSQKDIIDQIKKYYYNGQTVHSLGYTLNYDSTTGGGCQFYCDVFEAINNYYSMGKTADYSNTFYIRADIKGLALPNDITFSDKFETVMQKFGFGSGFTPDESGSNTMTLYLEDNSSLVLIDHLQGYTIPSTAKKGYELTYTETYDSTLSGGKPVVVVRSVTFMFQPETNTLSSIKMSVCETYALD
jgi:hypothetical protein